MNIPTVQPPRLKQGDTIAIIAPASTVQTRDVLNQGIATLENMGFRVQFDPRIFESSRYLAGTDAARAEELTGALADPSIQAIISLRGGYGCSRLIPLLKGKRLRSHPKIFMGFSDLTTLFLYFYRRCGWITFHGPMAATASLGEMPPDQQQHLLSLWMDPGYRPAFSFPELETWKKGTAEGPLVGGCLSLIVASLGTPYEIQTKGKILFLEDQGEPPYRLDRMLTHLKLAGKLESLAGLLLGNFPDCEPSQGEYSAKESLQDILCGLKIPIVANFPAGHIKDNWAIPLGGRVRLATDPPSIRFLDAAVR